MTPIFDSVFNAGRTEARVTNLAEYVNNVSEDCHDMWATISELVDYLKQLRAENRKINKTLVEQQEMIEFLYNAHAENSDVISRIQAKKNNITERLAAFTGNTLRRLNHIERQ